MPWLTEVPFAHRGLHDLTAGRPENTVAAFAAAVESGYGIELDVRITADRQLVVCHDDRVGRLTGCDVRISRSRWGRLSQLRLQGSDQGIPRLGDVLRLVGGRVPLMIEVKTGGRSPDQLSSVVAAALDGYRGRLCVASFDPRILAWFRRHASHVLRGQTAAGSEHPAVPRPLRRWLADLPRLEVTAPGFVAYELHSLPRPVTDRWRAGGHPLVAWTASTPADLEHARQVADNVVFEAVRP